MPGSNDAIVAAEMAAAAAALAAFVRAAAQRAAAKEASDLARYNREMLRAYLREGTGRRPP